MREIGDGRVPGHGLRQPVVEDLHAAVGCDLNIGGLQIAMDDAALVRGFECLRDLKREPQRIFNRQRSALQPFGERVALDQFEHEELDGCLP